jgi:hypothetical protein
MDELRKAVRLDPAHHAAHYNLGGALGNHGHFTEAASVLQRAFDLRHLVRRPWNDDTQFLQEAQRLAPFEPLLDRFAGGEAPDASAAERAGAGSIALRRGLDRLALRLPREALEADPSLATTNDQRYRYDAACVAARLCAGQSLDLRVVDDAERTNLRRQSLAWLQETLEQWRQWFDDGQVEASVIREKMEWWRSDPDLLPFREGPVLDALPAREQAVWRELWAAADELAADATEGSP